MTPEEAFNEIAQAIFELRRAFLRIGMNAPLSIELGSRGDGMKLKYLLPKDRLIEQPRVAENPEWVCNIVGLEIRYPGQWRISPGNNKEFV